ncbi:MAG: hypothetical protein HY784_05775, partial [Chloroflexi bacterium]|nr:hypothetical protein [Chloroflexota bacterium]
MRNTWLVLRHATGVTLRQRSFWLLTFIMPALLLGFQAYAALQPDRSSNREGEGSGNAAPAQWPKVGLVDEAGLLRQTPPGFPQGLFVPFAGVAGGRAALQAGQVAQVVHLPADYLASGSVTVLARDFQLSLTGRNKGAVFGGGNDWLLAYLINFNLSGDPGLAAALRDPTPGTLA